MKLFACQNCSNVLYFENTSCAKCGRNTGYLPDKDMLSAVEPDGVNWRALADPARRYRFCANWEHLACNWMVDTDLDTPFCRACRHNRTIPDISLANNHAAWVRIETAKRRLFYSLLKLRLPIPVVGSGHPEPLQFDFLDDLSDRRILTGHANGVVTIALREADDAQREQLRTSMNEPYRTLLGHFRHEIGHYYWDRLVRDQDTLDAFRAMFGDERADYEEARQQYYLNGPLAHWQDIFVSGYASMHPWEDFAETWAHYLHIVDTLEMAASFGIRLSPRLQAAHGLDTEVTIDPYTSTSAAELVAAWLPTTFAVNGLNRAMGQPDLYPFIISPAVVSKLDFVRALVQGIGGDRAAGTRRPDRRTGIDRILERGLAMVRQRKQEPGHARP